MELINESIKLGINNDGLKTGEAAVLFESVEAAKRAIIIKQGQNIGHRWVQLYQIPVSDYISFD